MSINSPNTSNVAFKSTVTPNPAAAPVANRYEITYTRVILGQDSTTLSIEYQKKKKKKSD